MGGGASKKYAEPEPEKLPASGPILFSVVVDLDGSGNLASLDYREDHADPASAATEFVAQHDLSPAQVGPIAAAVARKRDVVEAERAQREEEAREYAARPRAKPPEGKRPRLAGWHEETTTAWQRTDVRGADRAKASVATSGGVGLRGLSSAVAQARLLEAARYGRERELLTCVVEGNLSRDQLNAGGEDGATPLHLVARTGHLICCQALVEYGANVRALKPPDGLSALYIVCNHGHLDVVKFLLQQEGADLEASPDHGQSLSPFGAACVAGQLHIVRYLLEEVGDFSVSKWIEAAVYGRLPVQVPPFTPPATHPRLTRGVVHNKAVSHRDWGVGNSHHRSRTTCWTGCRRRGRGARRLRRARDSAGWSTATP